MSDIGESILTLAGDMKAFLNAGVANLPLTVVGASFIISLMTANYALLFMVLGMFVITPIAFFFGDLGFKIIFETISRYMFDTSSVTATNPSDLCDLIQPFPVYAIAKGGVNHTLGTYWMAMTIFFIAYVMSNAVSLLQKTTGEPQLATDAVLKMISTGSINRSSQAVLAMIMMSIIAIVVILMRMYFSRCESIVGFIVSAVAFGWLGKVWYDILASKGQDRLSDLFGIANRLLSPDALNNAPYACLPYTGTTA